MLSQIRSTHVLEAEEPVAAVLCKSASVLEHLLQRSDFCSNIILLLGGGVFGGGCRGGLVRHHYQRWAT